MSQKLKMPYSIYIKRRTHEPQVTIHEYFYFIFILCIILYKFPNNIDVNCVQQLLNLFCRFESL